MYIVCTRHATAIFNVLFFQGKVLSKILKIYFHFINNLYYMYQSTKFLLQIYSKIKTGITVYFKTTKLI